MVGLDSDRSVFWAGEEGKRRCNITFYVWITTGLELGLEPAVWFIRCDMSLSCFLQRYSGDLCMPMFCYSLACLDSIYMF